MKKLGYWGKHDVCVRCGQYIYNISIWLDPNRSNKTERPKEELPQAYLDILEKREWSVCDYTDDGRVELEWYSPAGEDFIVCVKVENFPDEILDYSDSFDPDELRALVMVSNCLEREFIHRQLAAGQPLHMNVL